MTISKITPLTKNPDDTTIKITFNGGDVFSQEFAGLISYEGKSKVTTYVSITNSNFVIPKKKISYQVNIIMSNLCWIV